MKVQIFSGNSRRRLEEDINQFIKGKKVISIAQSESYYVGKQWSVTITILYE